MAENTYGLRWSEDRVSELKGHFDAGLNSPEIATVLGVTFHSVAKKLSRLGLKRLEKIWTDERVEELKKLFYENLSASETAAKMGVGLTRMSIIGKWHRLGLKRGRKGTYRKPSEPTKARKPTICSFSSWSSFSVESKPQIIPAEPEVDVVPLHIPFDELSSKNCHWPYGNGPSFTFCGCDVVSGPYCKAHTSVAVGKGTASERSAVRVLERAAA